MPSAPFHFAEALQSFKSLVSRSVWEVINWISRLHQWDLLFLITNEALSIHMVCSGRRCRSEREAVATLELGQRWTIR